MPNPPPPPTPPPPTLSTTMITPTKQSSSSSFTGAGGANSILSEKVSRALQVRTETPAMKAALEALANLSSSSTTTPNTTNTTTNNNSVAVGGIDARSVRVAIEQDALYQARLLEGELRKLVDRVQTLRGQIRGVADVAGEVCRSIDGGVVLVSASTRDGGGGVGLHGIEEEKEGGNDGIEEKEEDEDEGVKDESLIPSSSSIESQPTPQPTATTTTDGEEEQHLAALLANAFHEREEASKRFEAITIFMEKFDVSENDSYLLDHYTFEHVFREGGGANADTPDDGGNGGGTDGSTATNGIKDGMAFLDALQRVSKIRRELATSFDVNTTNTTTGNNDDNDESTPPKNNNNIQLVASHLGATSAMRMLENLASKQERAYERLYHFLHNHLDLHSASVLHAPTSNNPTSSHLLHQHTVSEGKTNNHNTMDDDDDGMDITLTHPFIRRSLFILRDKPSFYTHTLELIATVRRSEVTRKFLMALTSGYGGMAAMEMKAHDPVNYVGDMLAFVFRTLSVESVLSLSLARVDEGGSTSGGEEEVDMEDVVVQPMSAVDVLNDTMSGVARPLRSRIAQVVGALACRSEDYDDDGGNRNEDGIGSDGRDIAANLGSGGGGAMEEEASSARVRLASIYSVCGLLLFYHSAIKKAVNKLQQPKKKSSIQDNNDNNDGDNDEDEDDANDFSKNNPIVRCLIECIQEAGMAYAASLKVHNALLTHYAVASNTTPAEIAHAAIVRLCNVRTASPGFDDEILGDIASSIPASSSSSSSQSDSIGTASSIAQYLSLEYLCETIIEGVLPSIVTNTESSGSDSRAARLQLDDASSIKAAIVVARKAGLRLTAGTKWDTIVKQREELLVEELIIIDTKEALDECGLGSIQRALESMKAVYIDGMSMASHQGLSRGAVENAMKTFYGSLYDMPFPDYEGIKDPVLRKHARSKLAKNVADVYGEVYGVIRGDSDDGHDGADCYGDLSFLEHTPEAVAILLSS